MKEIYFNLPVGLVLIIVGSFYFADALLIAHNFTNFFQVGSNFPVLIFWGIVIIFGISFIYDEFKVKVREDDE